MESVAHGLDLLGVSIRRYAYEHSTPHRLGLLVKVYRGGEDR
jgi:hypothetical protein